MDLDKTQKIIETIKTLNINFNDATTQKIADAVLPVVKMYLFRDILGMFLTAGVFILLFVLAFKLFTKMTEVDKEKEFKRLEEENG